MNYMLCVRTNAQHTDAIMGQLILAGAQGFEWRDHSIDPAIPENEVQLITYGTYQDLEPFVDLAAPLDGVLGDIALLEIQTVNWAESWKAYFKPLRISPRLAVVPSWEKGSVPLLDISLYSIEFGRPECGTIFLINGFLNLFEGTVLPHAFEVCLNIFVEWSI